MTPPSTAMETDIRVIVIITKRTLKDRNINDKLNKLWKSKIYHNSKQFNISRWRKLYTHIKAKFNYQMKYSAYENEFNFKTLIWTYWTNIHPLIQKNCQALLTETYISDLWYFQVFIRSSYIPRNILDEENCQDASHHPDDRDADGCQVGVDAWQKNKEKLG